MNLKKLSLLFTSALMFILVMTTIFKTISKSIYLSNEKDIAIIITENNIKKNLSNKVKAYNYVKIVETKKKAQPVKEVVAKPNPVIVDEQVKEVSASEDQKIYTGKMTGYGGDCPGCSGNLACKTQSGATFNLNTDGMYYNDSTYGNIRILSADTRAFPCGTVIQVNNGIMSEFTAIVLDTGGSMRSAWGRGAVWMDLAFVSNSDPSIKSANSNNTTFKVLRQGW